MASASRAGVVAFVAATTLALGAMAWTILRYVPPDMDGYVHYHALACWHYPNARLHSFIEPCNGGYDLKLLGGWNWPRSYPYVGASYSILYYPLFRLWPHWNGTALLGALLMIPGVLAASSLFRVRWPIMAMVLVGTYPILFYTLRDYGQLTLQLTLLFLLPWLACRAVAAATSTARVAFSLCAGAALAIGIESKPVLLYFLPSIAIVTLAVCWPVAPSLAALLRRLAPGIALASFATTILLTARVEDGRTYLQQMTGLTPPGSGLSGLLAHATFLLSAYWLNFPNVAGYIYGLKPSCSGPLDCAGLLLTLPFWLVALAAAVFYVAKNGRGGSEGRLIAALLLAGAVGVLAIGSNRLGVHPHHILQPFFLLLAALAVVLQRVWILSWRSGAWLLGILLASQLACGIFVARQQPLPGHDWDRVAALMFIDRHRLARTSVVNHLDWGTYYLSALYGPRQQLVLFRAPAASAFGLARTLGRFVTVVKRAGSSWEGGSELPDGSRLHRVFPEKTPQRAEPLWEVWTTAPPGAQVSG